MLIECTVYLGQCTVCFRIRVQGRNIRLVSVQILVSALTHEHWCICWYEYKVSAYPPSPPEIRIFYELKDEKINMASNLLSSISSSILSRVSIHSQSHPHSCHRSPPKYRFLHIQCVLAGHLPLTSAIFVLTRSHHALPIYLRRRSELHHIGHLGPSSTKPDSAAAKRTIVARSSEVGWKHLKDCEGGRRLDHKKSRCVPFR